MAVISLRPTSTQDIWTTLGIQNPKPYGMPTTDVHFSLTYSPVDFVRQRRQYIDGGAEDENVFIFKLQNAEDLELGLVDLIKSNVGLDVEFAPKLWFVHQLVSQMPDIMDPLQAPEKNHSQISPVVWETMLGVNTPGDLSKIKKCRYSRFDATSSSANCTSNSMSCAAVYNYGT
ncbi:hypothetical protein K440DRAFT_620870 [Wilcoxina mikolae CBS 423.85]|nr:hypothetical protein K440DRAFT_620870 [Wilcoxina mikolae CBS 423.85]